jgi:hypothetical protein
MTDTNATLATGAQRVLAGQISPRLLHSATAAKCSSAAEFRARRMFYAALSEFRSNVQDAAAISHAFDTQLLRFISIVGEHVPTLEQWDEAMARRVDEQ